ncbi:hypothetical protein LTR36_007177 [Oleoguttula mirabilis]|uniref:F-box domain-containing protein n=1 Tax=Oleoguttula mirabilis TaxID=1507867 RepID=A0AAV9JA30_9PEZI|nr:hypothetical protein LTR36_007177 [Oleoguttula mirabilis]
MESDPSPPPLMALGTDILTLVVDFVHDSHPRPTLHLALVSSYFHTLARYSQHRIITLKGPCEAARHLIHDRFVYIEKEGLLPAIRKLDIIHPWLVNTNLLARLLPQMTGLRDFKWPADKVPPHFLPTLQGDDGASPRTTMVRLHTQAQGPRVPADHNLHTLQANPYLFSLDVRINLLPKWCLSTTQPLKRLLLTCPNLRVLRLDIGIPADRHPQQPPEYCGLGFTDGEGPLAALEELVLTAYPFGTVSQTESHSHELLAYPSDLCYPGKVPELECWAENFDWSRLRRLQTGEHVDFALLVMPKLVALKEAALGDANEWRGDEQETRRFFRELPAQLEQIAVPRMQHIGLDGIMRHSGALRTLQIHRVEDWQGAWAAGAVTAQDLAQIRQSCPGIQDLGVDIARYNDDWPVWFALGLRRAVGEKPAEPVKPYATLPAAAILYNHLLRQPPPPPLSQRPIPPRIKQLIIHAGAPPPIHEKDDTPMSTFWPPTNTPPTPASSPRGTTKQRGPSSQSTATADWPFASDDDAMVTEGGVRLEALKQRLETERLGLKSYEREKDWKVRIAVEGPLSVQDWTGEQLFGYDNWDAVRRVGVEVGREGGGGGGELAS